jgi:asparagine synthase (glutamine-hydrolysing)
VCGICGVVNFDGRPLGDGVIERMTRLLAHRGPDSEGVHREGGVSLGATRLAVLDLERGGQPMSSADGTTTIVHNGEILNHAQLRRELESSGTRLRTSGDTEVVLELYRRHGPDFPRMLRGMFATAIWDSSSRRLVLARDPIGIKPLFYRLDTDGIAFASELRSIRSLPGFDGEISAEALHTYLAHNSIPGPSTIFRGTRKLSPGHVLVCEDGRTRIDRYARPQPAPRPQLRGDSSGALASELRERLRDSVRAHLVSDVPVGVLLSGGVDSGILTAIASEQAVTPPQTFSVGFAESSFDELQAARAVARRFGTDHHELIVEPAAARRLPAIAAACDEPLGDSSALPTYLVAEMASRHVKVVLCGEGADELFGGYETYVADSLAHRLPAELARVAPLLDRLPSSDRRVSLEYRAKRFLGALALPPLERHLGWKQIFSAESRRRLLRAPWNELPSDPLEQHRARFAETADADPLARLQDVDLGVYLVDDLLVKTDRMTMAHGLEARVPYLDPAVWELAQALPDHRRVSGLAKKRLLRRAGREWLPARALAARKKGFSIPAAAWLRGELEPFAREVLSAAELDAQGLLNPPAVSALLDEHVSRRRDNSRQIWGLMCLTLWRASASSGADPGR